MVHHAQKKFQTLKSASKVMASVLWDKDGILLVDYFKKSATITASYYTLPLPKEAGTGLQTVGKLSKGALFLQDNACPHTAAITQFKLADLLKYPVYSPDLAPCSPTLKNKRRHEIFETMRMPCLLQTTGLQANLQHSIWMT